MVKIGKDLLSRFGKICGQDQERFMLKIGKYRIDGKTHFSLRCLVKTYFQLRQQLLQEQMHFMCHLS